MGTADASTIDPKEVAAARALIAEGRTDLQIAIELDIPPSRAIELRREALAQGLLEVGPNRPVAEVYTEFRFKMDRVADDLADLAKHARGVEKEHIELGALKARAKVLDQVLERGQELGVLPRAARQSNAKVQIAAVMAVGNMTDPELVGHLGHLNRENERLRGDYEEVSFLDMPEPEVYPTPTVIDADEPAAPKRVRRRKA